MPKNEWKKYMVDYHFQDVRPIGRDDALRAFASGDDQKICDALIRVTYHDLDFNWVQGKCIFFAEHGNKDVQRLAIICMGHLVRMYNRLDIKRVRAILENLIQDRESIGVVQDALDDIKTFVLK